MDGETILCVATRRWDSLWRDSQQIMSRMAVQNRILYFDPGRNPDKAMLYELVHNLPNFARLRAEEMHPNVTVIPTPSSLPYARRHLSRAVLRAWLPLVAAINSQTLVTHIRRAMRRFNVKSPILWLYEPRDIRLIGRFGEKLVCYYNYDEYPEFIQNARIRDMLRDYDNRMTQRADVVFATSRGQYERRKKLNANTHFIPNGVNFELFNKALDPATQPPPDTLGLKRPIIGFAGWLGYQLDAELLVHVARKFPDATLLLVGPDNLPDEEIRRQLQSMPNVVFTGKKEVKELPAYLKVFDAALIPYVIGGHTLTVYPLKLHEYLAAGRAIVATGLPELRAFANVIRIGESYDHFIEQVRAAVADNSSASISTRIAVAKQNTWDQRVIDIYAAADRALAAKGVGLRIKCIAWTRYDRRPDLLAQHLGTRAAFISRGSKGKLLQAPAKYVSQARDTWRLLTNERPDVVFVQCPPIFAPLLVLLYCRRYGARYVVDGHTGAFLSPKWRWSLPLLRVAARGALTTLVTNDYLKSIVEGWGARANILAFTPGQYPPGEAYPFPPQDGFRAVVVSTFEIDEPLDVVCAAARRLPGVTFYITGNPAHASKSLLTQLPPNCRLTGFLPYEQYVGLLRGSGVVMDLTTRNHTLLMGAYEAISLGTPLIVSDWPVLRSYFGRAAICIPNTVQGICDGVARAQREQEQLRARVRDLGGELQAEWHRRFGELQVLVAQQPLRPPPRSRARAIE